MTTFLRWIRYACCWCFVVLFGFTNATNLWALSVVDQESLPPTGLPAIAIGSGVFTFLDRAQTFAVGQAGTLDRIDFSLSVGEGLPTELEFALYPTAGGVPVTDPGAALFTTQIPITSPLDFTFEDPLNTSVDVSAANIQVQPGLQLAWAVARSDSNAPNIAVLGGSTDYLGGQAFQRSFSPNPWVSSGNDDDQFFRTYVETAVSSNSTTLEADVLAGVSLEESGAVITLNPAFLVTQQLPQFDIDRRVVMEFPLDSLPENVRITEASIDLNVNLLTSSADEGPTVPVFGYPGDGFASIADASPTTNPLATIGPIFDTGPITVQLEPAYISELLGTGSHLGLAFIGSENGNQLGFDGFNQLPELTLGYEFLPTGDFDLDGDVDGADFLDWQRNPTVGSLANWQNHFGEGTGPAAAAIPEPASALLLSMCALLPACRLRRASAFRANDPSGIRG